MDKAPIFQFVSKIFQFLVNSETPKIGFFRIEQSILQIGRCIDVSQYVYITLAYHKTPINHIPPAMNPPRRFPGRRLAKPDSTSSQPLAGNVCKFY